MLEDSLTLPIHPVIPFIFSCIAQVITIIACLSCTNLSLASLLSRAMEVGIWKVIVFSQILRAAVKEPVETLRYE